MATIDGAKILGFDDKIGSVEVGKQADVIILDLNQAHLQPSYDIYSTLVYNTSGSDVQDSIINGKEVMEDRKVLTISEPDVIRKVQEISKKFYK
jgi:5-methylthioadenosine/S-adenosylhomocysteine deaminase